MSDREQHRAEILEIIALINQQHAKALEPYLKMLYEMEATAFPALRISFDEHGAANIEALDLRKPPP